MTEKELIDNLKKLNININQSQISQLNQYYDLLIEWNQKINLTSITSKEEVYLKHFYDCATLYKIYPLYQDLSLCDIGTGAGFPGIVLKILFPNLKIVLLDSLNKRILFLNEVIKKLGLQNIEAVHTRIEDYAIKNREKFDLVTARAVAHLSILLEYSIPMLKINGSFLAMKANVDRELEESQNAMKILKCTLEKKIKFELPKEQSSRTLLKINKLKLFSGKYPRKYSEIKKKRL